MMPMTNYPHHKQRFFLVSTWAHKEWALGGVPNERILSHPKDPLSPHPIFRYKAPVLQITWVSTINYHYLAPLELCVKVLNHHGIYTIYIYKIISTTTPLPSLPPSLPPLLWKKQHFPKKDGPQNYPPPCPTFSLSQLSHKWAHKLGSCWVDHQSFAKLPSVANMWVLPKCFLINLREYNMN